ncbi:MAG TPA: hypothetical protein VKW78_18185 [Terriglobales bacterium]|nr:hypothetical protein [Terriglobales bacterium]
MDDFSRQRADLENELDNLREQLLVADERYENATAVADRDAADEDCQRLRRELRARREELRDLNAERGSKRAVPRARAQAAGK